MSDKRHDKAKEKRDSWQSMLQARPVQNAAALVDQRTPEMVSIGVKTRRPRFFFPPISWVIHLPERRTVHLDKLGTQVWNLCDGTRTVEEMVDVFARQHELSFHEARVSVTGYMKTLVQRGALVIAMSGNAGDDE